MKNRRQLLKALTLTGVGVALGGHVSPALSQAVAAPALKGRVRHSVARWTYGDLDLPTLCRVVKEIGFSAIDLVGPDEWPILKQHGVDSSMCNGAELSLEEGWCDPQFHDALTKRYLRHIDLVADAGYKNLVCFSGNKRGMDPQAGLNNAVQGLRRVIPHAEQRGVCLHMELFNSKIDHPDYMADNSAWGIALCQALKSDNFKLLYDIYHMQISEGDIINTITANIQYFGHFHTAGVPGRHEINQTQELNYPAIINAINALNFDGYLAQEFIPTAKTEAGRIAALQEAILLCDV